MVGSTGILTKHRFHLEHSRLVPLAHGKSHRPEEPENGLISRQNLGCKSQKPLLPGNKCQMCEQFRPDSLILASVSDRQGDFCGISVAVHGVLTEAHDALLAALFLDGHQDHLLEIVHRHELLQHLMRNVFANGDEPLVHALLGEGVKEVLQQRLIADLNRAEQQLQAGARALLDLPVRRILALYAGNECLIRIDQMQPLGFFDQPVPEHGDGRWR